MLLSGTVSELHSTWGAQTLLPRGLRSLFERCREVGFRGYHGQAPNGEKTVQHPSCRPPFSFFSLLRLFFLFFFLFSAWRTRSARATVSNTHLHASTNTTTITKNRRIQFAQTDRSSLGHGRLCCNSAAYAWFSADFNSSLRCPTSPLLIVDDIVDTAPETRTLHGSTQGLCGTSNPGREQQLEWSVRLQTDQARQIPRGS